MPSINFNKTTKEIDLEIDDKVITDEMSEKITEIFGIITIIFIFLMIVLLMLTWKKGE